MEGEDGGNSEDDNKGSSSPPEKHEGDFYLFSFTAPPLFKMRNGGSDFTYMYPSR
jgi:hypothetical protein